MMNFQGIRTFIHSIRFRLVMWFMFILVIVLSSFSYFIYYNQARDIRGDALYHLERKYSDITDALQGASRDAPILEPSDVLVLLDSMGKVIFSQGTSSNEIVLDLIHQAKVVQPLKSNEVSGYAIWWIQDWKGSSSPYCFLAKEVNISGQTGIAILGNPFDPYGLNNRLLITLFLGSLITIVIALTGGLWLADRAMRPVHAITQAARTISETDLNHRINMTGKDELAELANTFDGMLARLQAAFERQRQFVADASHELRTPLTIVNLESNRALAGKRTAPEYQRALGVIRSENEFMSHLVGDLLTLARMDSGQFSMEKIPIDLSDIALESVERLESLAERKGVILETEDLPEVNILGDRQYLLQMMSNLVENAIKYTSGDEKRVRVETGINGAFAWVQVKDNGEGIPSEHIPQLFKRFYRVDKARTRDDAQNSGSGLGLSIVDWIVKAHNGEIKLQSQPNIGTTFEVRFPLIK